MYYFWLLLGVVSLLLGLLGLVLPLLPTVSFILLSAYCFSRSSSRLHVWLVQHPRFGPMIADWREYRAIAPMGKRMATLSILVVMGISIATKVPANVIAIQAVVLFFVLTFIWSRPDGPS
jgi:uncharacterized membrane protein YbaN (DUF454 family)